MRKKGSVGCSGRLVGSVGLGWADRVGVGGTSIVQLRLSVAVCVAFRANGRNSCTERQALKNLVKQNDDKQCDEVLIRRNDKSKANNCRVLVATRQTLSQG